MNRWFGVSLVVAASGVVLTVVAGVVGARSWSRSTDALRARLDDAPSPRPIGPAPLDAVSQALPPPVARYLELALAARPDRATVRTARLTQDGLFDMGDTKPSWKRFRSTQWISTQPPGFVWDAAIEIAPGIPARVHDAYVGGRGILKASLLGLIPLAKIEGEDEAARGELMRFLAESPWYPTALLPGRGVIWRPVDDHSADATLTDGRVAVTLRFTFGADGLVETVHADARGRAVGGRMVPTPWTGHWSNFALRDGLRVPLSGEVAWITPQGTRSYWRGTLRSAEYVFEPTSAP